MTHCVVEEKSVGEVSEGSHVVDSEWEEDKVVIVNGL